MFRLALSTLRFRARGFIASFLALCLGAAIVMACGGLMETGIRSAAPPQRLAAAPIVVAGDLAYAEKGRLDSNIEGRVRAIEGVAKVVADITFPVAVLNNRVPLEASIQGHGWSSAELTPYTLNAGTAPSRPDEVVLDAKIAHEVNGVVGQLVTIIVKGETQTFRLTGIVRNETVDVGALFFADDTARRLAGFGQDGHLLGVFPKAHQDVNKLETQIRDELRGQEATVLGGDSRGQAEFAGMTGVGEMLIILASVFGGIAISVAVFVVASTLALSIQQRMREMALLRAIGAVPGQLRRMILGETLVIAVFAVTFATFFSQYVGAWLLAQLVRSGVIPAEIVFHQGWIPTASAAGIVLLTAVGAAYIASAAAARVRPVEALGYASLQKKWVHWVRILLAVICLGGATALFLVTAFVLSGPVAASTAGPSSMLWVAGLALLGPGLVSIMAAILHWPIRLLCGLSGYLAMVNAKARNVRLASVVVAIMLSTGLATALIYLQTTQTSVSQRLFANTLTADAVLTSSVGGLPLRLVDVVNTLPGVAGVSAFVPSQGYFVSGEDADKEVIALQGVSAAGVAQTNRLTFTKGLPTDLSGKTVALPVGMANGLHKNVGDRLAVRMGDGVPVDLKVVALFELPAGYETMLMPADLVAEHTTSGLAAQILVKADQEVSAEALLSTLQQLASTYPGMHVEGRAALTGAYAEQEQTSVWINYLLVAMIVGYTVISLVNTLLVTSLERRREFALQRLIGSTRGQIVRMLLVESVFVAIAGILLGAVVAALTLMPFGFALKGSPMPEGPLWIYLIIVGFTTSLTILATILPALAVMRGRAIEATVHPE